MACRDHGRDRSRLTLLALTVILLVVPVGGQSATQWALFRRLSYLDGRVVETPGGDREDTLVGERRGARGPTTCAKACLDNPLCGSFFHVANASRCLLHSILFLDASEAAESNGTTYWQLTQPDRCDADAGFVLYRALSLCYRYDSRQMSWDQAEATCAANGSSLIKVDSPATFAHLYQFLRGSAGTRLKHVSIGAREQGGGHVWGDSSAVSWFNWAVGEPSSGSEHCVAMAWFYRFLWNDVPCSTAPISALCQTPV